MLTKTGEDGHKNFPVALMSDLKTWGHSEGQHK